MASFEGARNLTIGQRIKLFLLYKFINKDQKILDLGCGTMWLTKILRKNGFDCTGFALEPPADIIGDVKTYKFYKNEYDVVIALEMIEHVECYREIRHMLKPGGLLILSSPVPHFDWLCHIFEKLKVFQPRTTTHSHLFYLKDVPFKPLYKKVLLGISQFGVFTF